FSMLSTEWLGVQRIPKRLGPFDNRLTLTDVHYPCEGVICRQQDCSNPVGNQFCFAHSYLLNGELFFGKSGSASGRDLVAGALVESLPDGTGKQSL
ncbi:MAG TPA: hypothetical protein PKW28_16480, partial [Turneriella sp.]|nr:hypothetical protein [Turneriella sp.]